jgi:multicomponent Na+:H+ antiporter subunit D
VSAVQAIQAALLLPLAGTVLVLLSGKRPNLRESISLLIAVATFGVVLTLLPGVMAGGRPSFNLVQLFPEVWLGFRLEPLGMLFALVASGLWILTTAYAIGYMRAHQEHDQTRFFACFALAIFAALGVAFARNLVTLFLFYELLTVSTYPLVTHAQNDAARRTGRTYMGILMGTSVALLLLAVIWTWDLAGTVEFRPGGILEGRVGLAAASGLLLLFVFGTGKAALMPFHRWLPAAMVAPTPVSALLHAVAVVKAGVFTVMKVSVYVFGTDFLATVPASDWLCWVAAFTILCSSMVAFTKDNLKARLAYSTVSQLSYIVLGAMLAAPDGVLGGSMHIAMHAVGKITLFFCAGAIMVASHKTEISSMNGLGRRMPWTFAAFTIGAIAVIGLPPTGGAWSKWYLALGALESDRIALLAVLMISSLLNIAYLLPIPARAFFMKPAAPAHHDQHGGQHDGGHGHGEHEHGEAPLFCLVPLCLTAVGCVVLFFQVEGLYELLAPLTGGGRG